MSKYIKSVITVICCSINFQFLHSEVVSNNPFVEVNDVINELKLESKLRRTIFLWDDAKINDSITLLNSQIQNENIAEKKLNILIHTQLLQNKRDQLWRDFENDISKTRYLKGIEIIRILYDKVLSLDHHFSAVRTFSEINKISNPNNYPEFNNLKELLRKNEKKAGFNLSNILGNNIYVSVIQTLSSVFTGGLNKDDREKELQQVECILDFTLRMNNDLNTIFYETSFLQTSNAQIKEDIEKVFKDYVKPIGYFASLEDCRSNDDWDELKSKLNEYMNKIKVDGGKMEGQRMQINLEFSVDRLLQFIVKYNSFIDDGTRFYQKFKTIINSYENKEQCKSKLPIEYNKLSDDVENSIKKFNVAYRSVEINGTKLKELLYGTD